MVASPRRARVHDLILRRVSGLILGSIVRNGVMKEGAWAYEPTPQRASAFDYSEDDSRVFDVTYASDRPLGVLVLMGG
jgi:hypothetical protein